MASTIPGPPPTTPTPNLAEPDVAELDALRTAHGQIRAQIAQAIIGQDEVVDQLLIAVFARGHCILEGVPGLAKTLMVQSLAQSLSLDFNRIQFTPDLMPSDITGTEVLYEDRTTGARELRFVPGPLFANLVLADEINRTPPKTQAALLEAMQERAGHGRRPAAQAARAVLRPRHAEPDRAGGDVPAPRGAARPIPVQDLHQVPHARRGAADLPPDDRGRHAGDPAADLRRADRPAPADGPPGPGVGPRDRLRDGPRSAPPARPTPRRRSSSATGSPGAPGRAPGRR